MFVLHRASLDCTHLFEVYDGRGQCLDLRIGEHSTTPVHDAIANCPYGLGYVCSKLFTKHGFVDREALGLLINSIAGWKGYIGVASCAVRRQRQYLQRLATLGEQIVPIFFVSTHEDQWFCVKRYLIMGL